MVAQTREWADVFVEDVDARTALEHKVLFYIPAASQRGRMAGQSVQTLLARKKLATREEKDEFPGKTVIENVWSCHKPVQYENAVKFLNLINVFLPEGEKMTKRDVVACVFRLQHTHVLKDLGIDYRGIAAGIQVREEVVLAAVDDIRYRIPYVLAERIWTFLVRQLAATTLPPVEATPEAEKLREQLLHVLDGDPLNFIIADSRTRHPLAIKEVGAISNPQAGQDDVKKRFVFARGDLVPAPETGHPWAVRVP